jgi:hypothetical protein
MADSYDERQDGIDENTERYGARQPLLDGASFVVRFPQDRGGMAYKEGLC